MPRWTFVRHGESTANAEGWVAGQSDAPLTEKGREQARGLASVLLDVPFDRVLVSDLSRAYETARIALPGRPLNVHVGLRERTLGEWDGRSHASLEAMGGKDTLLTLEGRPPGGESHLDLLRRVLGTLAELDGPDDTLVVAHGGVLRAVLGTLDELQVGEAVRLRIPNVGVQTRSVPEGTWGRLLEGIPRGA